MPVILVQRTDRPPSHAIRRRARVEIVALRARGDLRGRVVAELDREIIRCVGKVIGLAQRVERSGLTLDELLNRYLNVAIIIEPASVPQIARDPDDDHVLACALEARADLIVTGDADLLTLKTYQDIPIVTAAEAMRKIEARK